jgi:putative SOS response-associated peptidase YedK
MPLILPQAAYARWLDAATPMTEIDTLAGSPVGADLTAAAVSTRVNTVRNEGAELLEPAPATPDLFA